MLSSPADVFRTFAFQSAADPGRAIQDQWMSTSAKCKDVLVMAMPLKDIPVTKEAFAEHDSSEFIRAQFYIVRVAPVDGQDWGWSNAPYDSSKKTPRAELQSLYTVDTQGETKGEARFWAFKKVSNNKNKGVRIEGPVDGFDTSFVLPRGSVLTFFMREDSYDAGKHLFVNSGDHTVLPAFTPVILQLSGTNGEQALKGNGLKLRRIMPLRADAFSPFMDDLSSSKREAVERQDLARSYPAISNVAGRTATCPVVCNVLSGAFVFQDEDLATRGMIEIVESGLELDVGSVLLMPTAVLMAVVHTLDFERAKRFLSLALAHGAVKCVVVPADGQGEAVVVNVHVDVQKMLWLDTLQQMRSSDHPAELPNTDTLVACFGRRMGSDVSGVGFGSEGQHDVLQVDGVRKVPRRCAADARVSAVVQPVEGGVAGCGGRQRDSALFRLRDGPGHEALSRRRRSGDEVLPHGRSRRPAPQPARVPRRPCELRPRVRSVRERRPQDIHHVAASADAQQLRHPGSWRPRASQAPLPRARRHRPHQLGGVMLRDAPRLRAPRVTLQKELGERASFVLRLFLRLFPRLFPRLF
jgi:hypothetical protein